MWKNCKRGFILLIKFFPAIFQKNKLQYHYIFLHSCFFEGLKRTQTLSSYPHGSSRGQRDHIRFLFLLSNLFFYFFYKVEQEIRPSVVDLFQSSSFFSGQKWRRAFLTRSNGYLLLFELVYFFDITKIQRFAWKRNQSLHSLAQRLLTLKSSEILCCRMYIHIFLSSAIDLDTTLEPWTWGTKYSLSIIKLSLHVDGESAKSLPITIAHQRCAWMSYIIVWTTLSAPPLSLYRTFLAVLLVFDVVSILGDKYGYRPFPPEIEQSEFESIILELEKAGKNAAVLRRCFRLDENSVPPHYILLPIVSIYPTYRSHDKNERSAASSQVNPPPSPRLFINIIIKWWKDFEEMQFLLREGSVNLGSLNDKYHEIMFPDNLWN